MRQNSFKQKVLAAVLTIAALAVGQGSAWAENTWSVSNTSGSTFTIIRSGDLSVAETVCFRTVSLSAIAESTSTTDVRS